MSRLRKRLTYANVIATLALVLVVGGGSAIAASQFGKESIPSRALKKESIGPGKLTKAAKATLTGAPGPAGPAGPAGAQGPAGTARAYGVTKNVDGTLDPARSKNATVRRAAAGTYCITPGAGIDAASSIVVASPDFSGPINGKFIAQFRSSGIDCNAGELEVKLFEEGTAKDGWFSCVIP
jgi:hypothetical protein